MSGEGLLPSEPAIAVQREVIRALGGHDLAVFVQQVNYSCNHHAAQERDGFKWAVRSNEDWCEDCVLTPRQAQRIISTLVKMGVLVRWQPEATMDRRAWTRLDRTVLDPLLVGAMHRNVSRTIITTERVDTGYAKRCDVPSTKKSLRSNTENPAQEPMIAVDSWFDAFWNSYPRKVAKPAAMKAWKTANGDRDARTILDGLDRWIGYWQWDNEPRFVPHPATWLNQRRWEDETPPRTRSRNGKATTMDKLRELEFDEHGMMVGP